MTLKFISFKFLSIYVTDTWIILILYYFNSQQQLKTTDFWAQDVCDTGNFINSLFLKQNPTVVYAGSSSGVFSGRSSVLVKEKKKKTIRSVSFVTSIALCKGSLIGCFKFMLKCFLKHGRLTVSIL